MNKKTIILIAASATILLQLCAICFSFIALILAIIISDVVIMLLSIVLISLGVFVIWFLLKVWETPANVFESQVGSISKKKKRGVKKK